MRCTVDGYTASKQLEYEVFSKDNKFLGDDTFRNHFYSWFAAWIEHNSRLQAHTNQAPEQSAVSLPSLPGKPRHIML
jgi:hypothetical protein